MINIRKLLDDHNIRYWSSGKNVSEGWTNITCPLCSDNSNHGGFSPDGEKYNCWKCGSHNILKILSRILKRPALETVRKYKTASIIRKRLNQPNENKSLKIPGKEIDYRHKEYLFKRKFNPDLIKSKYKITGTGILGDYKYRIIIPIFYQGKAISYLGRDITNQQEIRYKTCPKAEEIIHHKNTLYNIDNCNNEKIIVVEGILDTWRFGDDCAATFGTGWTKKQALLLMKYKKVFLLYDNDQEAQKKAESLANTLSVSGTDCCIIDIGKYGDPAEIEQEKADMMKKNILKD